jgi:hypothetical protein
MNATTRTEALALSNQSAAQLNAIIQRDAWAFADARSRAAARILSGMKRLTPTTKGSSGRQLLRQARYGRHGV